MRTYFSTTIIGLLFCLQTLHAGDDDFAKEIGVFVMDYHKKPEPQRVPRLLDKVLEEKFLANPEFDESRGLVIMAHSFGHMARGQADLVRLYEAKFTKAKKEGRAFLLDSLRLCGDEQTLKHLNSWRKDPVFKEQHAHIDEIRRFLANPKRKLPRDQPPFGPTDLDLLWADFFVTGEYAPIARILDVLDRPDGLRRRLENWLKKHPDQKKKLNDVLADLKLIKTGTKDQWIDGNLELRALHDARGLVRYQLASAFSEFLQEELQFSPDELSKGFVLKLVASWSMQSNLENYPQLAKQLKAHYKTRPEPTQDLIKRWLRLDEHQPRLTEEMKRLQGTWQALTWQEDGDKSDPKTHAATLKYVRWIFKDDEVHWTKAFTVTTNDVVDVRGQGGTNKFTYTIDAAKKIKVLKVVRFSPQESEEIPVIYAIEGDLLKACMSKKDGVVPTDFTVPPGSERILITLKRVP